MADVLHINFKVSLLAEDRKTKWISVKFSLIQNEESPVNLFDQGSEHTREIFCFPKIQSLLIFLFKNDGAKKTYDV